MKINQLDTFTGDPWNIFNIPNGFEQTDTNSEEALSSCVPV